MRDAAAREQTGTETGADGPGLRVPFSGGEKSHAPAARRRIAKLVAAKLTLDLLFVVAFAAYTHADTFLPTYDGALEQADVRGVRGWVVDRLRPGAPVEVQLYVDGRFVAAGLAYRPHAGVAADGAAADERRGFSFEFDSPLDGAREARVYAVRAGRGGSRRTLRQVGAPRAFATR